jgi:glycosyltransferase 2 family protein
MGESIPLPVAPARARHRRRPQPRARHRRRRQRRVRIAPMTILRIVVTAGAFALIARKVGVGAVTRALATADPAYLAAGYAIAIVTILLTVWQWNGLATANGVARPFRRCLHLELGGDVFDAALPSSIGGDFIRATSLAESPEERVPAAASVVLRRLCNFPGMIVLTAVGVAGTLSLHYANRVRPFSFGVLLGGFVLVVLALSPAMGVIGRWGLLRRGPGRAVAKLLNTLHEFRGERRALGRATLRGVLFWVVVVASQSMFIRALGIHVPVAYAALVITTATAVTMLPISLGGYGLREGAFAAFLAAGGHATAAQGAAVGVCITVQTLALGVIGIPFYLTIRARRLHPVASPIQLHPAMEAA